MKRRTSLPPNKHINDSKRTLKRSHTMLESGRSASNNNGISSSINHLAGATGGKESASGGAGSGGMYRSELNQLDVENGYGMGMAIAPLSSRGIKV